MLPAELAIRYRNEIEIVIDATNFEIEDSVGNSRNLVRMQNECKIKCRRNIFEKTYLRK